MIGQYLPNKTKVILFIGLKFFQHVNVAANVAAVAVAAAALRSLSANGAMEHGHWLARLLALPACTMPRWTDLSALACTVPWFPFLIVQPPAALASFVIRARSSRFTGFQRSSTSSTYSMGTGRRREVDSALS
jgi:hypothetical protein